MWIHLEYLLMTAQPGKSHKTHGQPTVKFCIKSLLTEKVGIKTLPLISSFSSLSLSLYLSNDILVSGTVMDHLEPMSER